MRGWDGVRIAELAGAQLLGAPSRTRRSAGPSAVGIDSRATAPGELFVGLRGERANGGSHAGEALAAGAWGVLVDAEHAPGALEAAHGAIVLAHPDPLAALQALAKAWRRELAEAGASVVAITGSAGKTSTKDILATLLSPQRRVATSPENFNTEIGLPLAVLGAPRDTEVLILELAMRGAGQIAELTDIAEPDVGVIVNLGPVHLELLGSLEEIAAAKAELIAGLAAGKTVVLPADEPLLAAHLRRDVRTVTFGEGGEVTLVRRHAEGVSIRAGERQIELRPSFSQAHNLQNLLAAVGAARALGITPRGKVDVRFSARRGERHALDGGVVLIDDCYNANPMSTRAAIDELAATAPARRVAVLGDMLELGADSPRLHREIGAHAAARGVDLLVTVGPLAAEMRDSFTGEAHAVADAAAAVELLRGRLRSGDTVLVKGSRGVRLERVVDALRAEAVSPQDPVADAGVPVPAAAPEPR
jgi:UDP-N-acetylmuramoyl-tripeptide--D-alanyl-D-alanine ligase